MGDLLEIIVFLFVCFMASIIAYAVIGPLFNHRFPDIQEYAGPIIVAAFVAAAAVGIMFWRQDRKNVKITHETAYEEGFNAGKEKGYEDGYFEGYTVCEMEHDY